MHVELVGDGSLQTKQRVNFLLEGEGGTVKARFEGPTSGASTKVCMNFLMGCMLLDSSPITCTTTPSFRVAWASTWRILVWQLRKLRAITLLWISYRWKEEDIQSEFGSKLCDCPSLEALSKNVRLCVKTASDGAFAAQSTFSHYQELFP